MVPGNKLLEASTGAVQTDLAHLNSLNIPAKPSHNAGSTYASHRSAGNGANSFVEDGGDTLRFSGQPEASELSAQIDQKTRLSSPVGSYRLDLVHALRKAKRKCTEHEDRFFIPIDQLENLITPENILVTLTQFHIGEEGDRDSLIHDIWDRPTSPSSIITTRRKIFATLILSEKVETIQDFIKEDIHDNDLPITFNEDEEADVAVCKGGKVVRLFKPERWSGASRDNFDRYQWWLLSPYFHMSFRQSSKPLRYSLPNRTVLPYIESSTPEEQIYVKGGQSIVRKVRFHPEHFNRRECGGGENPFFAVKQLNAQLGDINQHNKEYECLTRLNSLNHPHLIRLLVTFEHNNCLHLVFPWADGNLQNFWMERFPHANIPLRNDKLAKWMADQVLGLAKGLQAIHCNPIDEKNKEQKKHGRHGDLKPENILWFSDGKQSDASGLTGNLKISDFGMTDFHGTQTKDGVSLRKTGGFTPTYRAPEWDITKQVGPSYDIWSFGCVLLEFVQWYLHGENGVRSFVDRRIKDSITEIPGYLEDNFFDRKPGNERSAAVLKESVLKEIIDLRADERCSDFIMDLLNIIQKRLLRMDPSNRADCDEVVQHLSKICERCETPTYCTLLRESIPERQFTDTSELCQGIGPQKDKAATSARTEVSKPPLCEISEGMEPPAIKPHHIEPTSTHSNPEGNGREPALVQQQTGSLSKLFSSCFTFRRFLKKSKS